MDQVHLIYSTKSDVPNSDILCDATNGATFRVFNTSNNMDESLVRLMDDDSSKKKKPSDYIKSKKTYDLSKLVYLMVSGRQVRDDSLTGQITGKKLTETEAANVRAAYERKFPPVAPKVLTEEEKEERETLLNNRQQSRIDAEANNPLLKMESAGITEENKSPTQTTKPIRPKKIKTTKKNDAADGKGAKTPQP